MGANQLPFGQSPSNKTGFGPSKSLSQENQSSDPYKMLLNNYKKYNKHKVVATLQKVMLFCRWADIGGGGASN